LELRQYLDILKRHKWFIIEAIVVVGLAAGILSSLRTPIYEASARVLLRPGDLSEVIDPTNAQRVGNDPDRYVEGQKNIVQSEGVTQEALKSLSGFSSADIEGRVSVSQGGQSDILKISATDPDPILARDIANAVAEGYIENRRLAAVARLQRVADDIGSKLGPILSKIAELDNAVAALPATQGATPAIQSPARPATSPSQIDPLARGTDSGAQATTVESLKAARYASAVQYEELYGHQQNLLIEIGLKRGEAEIVSEAKTPTAPISPRPRRDAALGVFAGLLLGAGVTLLREQLNDKIRSAEEVGQLTGLPLLARLPYDDSAASVGVSVDQTPNSPLSEAMRSLRTSIQYQSVDRPVRVVVVTSALPGEGKSLVATNLAAAFAQADYRTILMSADLRRPSVNGVFGDVGPSPGLVGLMGPRSPVVIAGATNGHRAADGSATPEARTVEALLVTPIPGLLLLPSGLTPPNPAELLGSRRMATILAQLSAMADMIVIDSPPLLPVTDAAVLATRCDGVVLVAAADETPRSAIERAKTILDATGARILGTVVNKARTTEREYYYGGYGVNRSPTQGRHRRKRSADVDNAASNQIAEPTAVL
jgi:succinoglycan biosynthesis transport protein ExoP